MNEYDYMIVGSGVIGLCIAKELNKRYPDKKIVIIEKEKDVAMHSSGRNSGVLHAGFYYTSNSLKAKFTRDGNIELTKFCEENGLKINKCKKVVVTKDESELETLEELYKRGLKNGVEVELKDEKWLSKNYPNVKTYKKVLFSPNTATVDPIEVTKFLKDELVKKGVEFRFNTTFKKGMEEESKLLINCAGVYADRIAKEFGFSKDYTIIPFKGIYLKYSFSDKPIDVNIYPVPNLKNPFLGVHYTVTVDNTIKIGPTAIPAFWRENYEGFSNFKIEELLEIARYEAKLFFSDAFGFRKLAFEEIKKYNKEYFISLAVNMVKDIKKEGFREWSKPGIRAQLLNTKTLELLQDFVVEGDKKSVHILNAVSPAFTSSFPFARWVVDNYIEVI
jgi:L-2-hydroxyglutarate oxidase LhgO